MKGLMILSYIAVLFVAFSLAAAEEFYCYQKDERIILRPCEGTLAITWQKGVLDAQKRFVLNTIQNQVTLDDIKTHRYHVTVIRCADTRTQDVMRELYSMTEVAFVHVLLCTENNDTLILTNELAVKLTPQIAMEDIRTHYRLELLWIDPCDSDLVLFEVPKHSEYNALRIGNLLTERGIVEYASANFIIKYKLHIDPNDTYYNDQWALPLLEANIAWEYETGSSDIVVAVLDEGVDLDHPDLANVLVTGYDACDDDYVPQCDPADAHGTCCVGIIGAIMNNDEGVAGIAGGWGGSNVCRIMPIRISENGQFVSSADIKYCFEWAANHSADIISCSWGGPWSDVIHDGIEYAVNQGCLILASAGNENTSVRYPASDPLCIAVGATNENDQRWWYSCYGSDLDVMAPSGNVNLAGNIWTTDNTGSAGYYPYQCEIGSPDGNYMGNFGGTSAACPYAAGIAALMWSKYPSVSAATIREILLHDTEDLGAIGWDQYYGWGRVSAIAPLVCCQPDNLVKRWWDSGYMGNDIYNATGSGQYTIQFSDPYQWASYHVKIENDGTTPEVINVKTSEQGTGDWTTVYYDALSGGNDITNHIKSSEGWSSGVLNNGEGVEILVRVMPGSNVNGMIKRVTITSRTRSPSTEKIDVVYMDTQCNILQPDNQIKNSSDVTYIGDDIYNITGQYQTKSQNTLRRKPAIYHLKIENDGETFDLVWVNGPGSDANWTIEYYDAITGGNNITSSVLDGTYFIILYNPGESENLRVEVTPTASCPWAAQKEVLVVATAGYNANKKDAVKAITKCVKHQADPMNMSERHAPNSIHEETSHVTRQFAFEDIHPNPFNDNLHIKFYSPDMRAVSVRIYDIQGRLVQCVQIDEVQVGMNNLAIPQRDLAEGVYLLTLQTNGFEVKKRLVKIQ